MATKSNQVTQEDLLRTEAKISEEQTKYRHELKNNIQNMIMDIDEIKTETALLTQSVSNMKDDIKEIKSSQHKLEESIIWMRDSLLLAIETQNKENKKEFALRVEHNVNAERITKIENIITKIAWTIIMAVLAAVLSLVIMK